MATAARGHAGRQGAPPVMRRSAAPPSRYAPPPLASLSAVPAVQRACAACDEKERRHPIQPRLEVGPVGDRYEQEADSIAARVMAMPDPGTISGAATPAEGLVQRACACSSSRDEPRARRRADDVEETVSMVRARRDAGPETLAASDTELTSGGSPLPAATRSYFEGRMGRDLSSVRVHQGGSASAMNASIAARAFTYRNHVWLGANESAGPSFTMAHELAHVMQQTAPGPVGPVSPRVQRAKCDPNSDNLFFAPVSGTPATRKDAEQLFIGQLSSKSGVIGEAPVPNGLKKVHGCQAIGTNGYSDLVWTDTGKLPGFRMVRETGTTNPRPWYSPKPSDLGCVEKDGQRLVPQSIKFPEFSHFNGSKRKGSIAKDAAPTWSNRSGYQSDFYTTVDQGAPTQLKVGEVKFGGTPHARTESKEQIGHYIGGFEFAHTAYESMRTQIDGRSNELDSGAKPKLKPWNLKTGELTSIAGAPTNWTGIAGDQKLVVAKWTTNPLKGWGEDGQVPTPCSTKQFDGKLFGGQDSQGPFTWLYAWYPNAAPPENLKGSAQYTEYRKTAGRLIALGLATPAKKNVQRLPVQGGTNPGNRYARPAPPIVQRAPKAAKPIPKTDSFQEQYDQWKLDRKALSERFGAYRKTDDFTGDTMSLMFNQALKNTKEITGTAPNSVEPDTGSAMKEAEHDFRYLELMAGPAGAIFGELRYRMGGLFLTVLNAYQKVRDKLEGFFKDKGDGSRDGNLAARALKVFIKIVGKIASYMLPRVTDALIECVETGFTNTLRNWIDDSPIGALEKKLQGYYDEAKGVVTGFFADIEKVATDVFGPVIDTYLRFRDDFQKIADIVNIAKQAFDVARAAACLAGGLETAGISCIVSVADKLLSLVGLSPSEHLLAWLLETCTAREYFTKALLAIHTVKTLPQVIAQKIVEFLKDKLPPWLKGFLCDPATMVPKAGLPSFDEVACDEESSNDMSSVPLWLELAPVNRPPTKEEAKDHGGFDVHKWASQRPKVERPADAAPPPDQTGATPPPAATPPREKGDNDNDNVAAQSDTATFSVDIGKIKPTSTVLVTFRIHGIGRGFAVQKYNPPEERDVGLSFVLNKKNYASGDILRIRVLEVISPEQSGRDEHVIRFTAVEDYRLNMKGSIISVPKNTVLLGYLGKRQ
ncbi:hypothetical protein BH10PSE14_BH10PSE14_03810 [soil metagenome]